MTTIKKLSIIPYDSYYDNVLINMSKNKSIKLKIYNEDDYPTFYIKNAKLIYLDRLFKEIKQFKSEIQKEISESSKKIANNSPFKQRNPTKSRDEEDVGPFFRLKLKNSCFVFPRNSNSKDLVLFLFDKADVKFGNSMNKKSKLIPFVDTEMRVVHMPTRLRNPFKTVQTKAIIPKYSYYKEEEIKAFTIRFNFTRLIAFYQIAKRNIKLIETDKFLANIILPDRRVIKDEWSFDSHMEFNFEDFNIAGNIVTNRFFLIQITFLKRLLLMK